MGKFLMLLDYKNDFLISIEDLHTYRSMNSEKVAAFLREYGHSVEMVRYSDLNFDKDYRGFYVLYQTAEDWGVFYKDYIEDIVYFLEQQGAIPLPRFTYLLAHHNKNFMELLRKKFAFDGYKTISSKLYGTADDALEQNKEFPLILKSAEGSGSSKVFLARDPEEFSKRVRELSGVFLVNCISDVKEFIIYLTCLRLFNKVQSKYRNYTFYRKKFIIQNFIEGLEGDYKVLYFGGKYYCLYRKNRDNDFRASGSGKLFPVPDSEIPGLLEFASKLTQEIDFPVFAADIGFDGYKYHLLEFQCIHIGPYTLQASQYWHEYKNGEWVKFLGKSNLEEEYCRAINDFVKNSRISDRKID